MKEVYLRNLTVSDNKALANIRLETLVSNPYSFSVTEQEEINSTSESGTTCLDYYATRDDACVIGAWNPGLMGVVGIERYLGSIQKHKMRIWGPYVPNAYRNQGLGSKLLEEAMAYARSLSEVELVCLETSEASKDAIKLFLSMGFVEVGREVKSLKFDRQYFSLLRMQYEISTS